MKNEIMLITYADSLGKNLSELGSILNQYLQDVVGSVHILPFYPSSADRGFAPMTYEEVDPEFGSWNDVKKIALNHDVMVDFMINHISRSSIYFQDFVEHKDASPYADLFIRYKKFWPNGEPSEVDVDRIYKRKPRAPYIDVTFADGTSEQIWCTFDEEQIDLNMYSPVTRQFVKEQLIHLAKQGASFIRLDAFAYATKKVGTNCFFVEPDTWDMLSELKMILEPYHVELLPEIHEHYSIQLKLAEHGYYVYDFALPMLVLHALYSGRGERLAAWLAIAPKKQFTTLDTHDGIGVVDVADLMTQEEIDQTKDYLFDRGANVKRIYNTLAYNNLDIYQVNCTYYSALGNNDNAYLLARAIQFFAPGIPQVYYVGLLAGENDIDLLEKTKLGRNINRHYYSMQEVAQEMERPVVKQLFKLMKFRNAFHAFDGDIEVTVSDEGAILVIRRTSAAGDKIAILTADLRVYHFAIEYQEAPETEVKKLILSV